MSNYFILLGAARHLDFFRRNDLYSNEPWFWTCPKSANKGDFGFVYLNAPVSQIVGCVKFIGEPFYNVDMFPRWANNWMVEIGEVKDFSSNENLTIAKLRELFPDGGWLRYPRGKTKIPAEILKPFLELVGRENQ